jgi:amino acid transporter
VKLSTAFPSQGGTVTFLDRAFRPGLLVGSLNILLWLSYIVMLALYSYAFGSYGASFFPEAHQEIARHLLVSGSIVVITALNLFGADVIGKAETWIVALKVLILLAFLAIGLPSINTASFAASTWASPVNLMAGGMIIFLAYEGFELIANTAEDIDNAKRNLPRAFFISVIFVILLYIAIAAATVGSLSLDQIIESRDYALAEAARPMLGQFGFRLIAVAALLSTSSAINATLYGAARLSYTIAKDGELPVFLEKRVWHRPVEGLLITSAVTLLAANVLDLSSISVIGSVGFLIIFAAVSLANFKLRSETKGHAWISLLGLIACLGAIAAVLWYVINVDPIKLFVLAGLIAIAVSIEAFYRFIRGRKLSLTVEK